MHRHTQVQVCRDTSKHTHKKCMPWFISVPYIPVWGCKLKDVQALGVEVKTERENTVLESAV